MLFTGRSIAQLDTVCHAIQQVTVVDRELTEKCTAVDGPTCLGTMYGASLFALVAYSAGHVAGTTASLAPEMRCYLTADGFDGSPS